MLDGETWASWRAGRLSLLTLDGQVRRELLGDDEWNQMTVPILEAPVEDLLLAEADWLHLAACAGSAPEREQWMRPAALMRDLIEGLQE